MTSITERALLRRINRKLAHEGQRLHKTRPANVLDLGKYHCVNDRNIVTDYFVELTDLGKELNVIAPHEQLVLS